MRVVLKGCVGAALVAGVPLLLSGCSRSAQPDAYGTFEATEVVVSAQTTGQIEQFVPVEGMQLASGVPVALIDTTQLALRISNLIALIMLFASGWALGRHAGGKAWLGGLVMVLLGTVLVGTIIALGG